MNMRKYAQIDKNGTVFATLETAGEVDAPDMIEHAESGSPIGKLWSGGKFVDAPADASADAVAKLAALDAQAGMSRLLRECFAGLLGNAAPQRLKDVEAQAAAERAKVKK